MYNRILLIAVILTMTVISATAQNFSGLQNKRLTRVDDLGTTLESLLGGLGGGLDGSIDSVVVLSDSEKELKCRIYYTGYANAYFVVTTMNDSRQREPMISRYEIPAGSPSPLECTLKFDPKLTSVTKFESPYFRVDISKKQNRPGKVKIFLLRKKWATEQQPEYSFQEVKLQPIGIAASLGPAPKDFVPARRIKFETKYSNQKLTPEKTMPMIRDRGGNAYHAPISLFNPVVDITGTWNNKNANAESLVQLVINGTSMRSYKKCSPNNCDLGSSNLTPYGPDGFTTQVFYENTTAEVRMKLVNTELSVDVIQKWGIGKKTTHFTFVKQNPYFNAILMTDYVLMDWTKPTTQPVSTVAEGAGSIPLDLWNNIAVDPLVDFQRPQDISNINITVFPDKNPHSGMYYIYPADYHLRWTEAKLPEEGYDFTMLYGKQGSETTEPDPSSDVRISATLTSGITPRERALVKAILTVMVPKFVDVDYLPLREIPETTFPASLNAQFGVPLDRITVNAASNVTTDIKIAWRTNPDTKEFIQSALLSREGIPATVILKPMNKDISNIQIPAMINLADTRSLGKMQLEPVKWRTRAWKNSTPYPLRMKYIHVMKKSLQTNDLIIYSWSINNLELPSGQSISFDHSKIPNWLDTDPTSNMWIDYEVLPCSECDNKVLTSVTKGVFGNTLQQIRYTIAPAMFDSLGAEYFLVTMRSKQADPKNEMVRELPSLKIIKDMSKDFLAGPLYLAPNATPAFEYQVTVLTKAGDFYKSTQWISATEKDILLGRREMKSIFGGVIPGWEQ